MGATVRVHAFSVVAGRHVLPLEDLIARIKRQELVDRVRTVGGTEMRLDSAKWVSNNRTGFRGCFLDFVRIRDTHGPGRVSRSRTVEGFDLDEDEFFGEEVAALFVPASGHILVQYNHFGVKSSMIEEYFSDFSGQPSGYRFNVVLDSTADRKFLRSEVLRRFEISMDLRAMDANDRAAGESLGEMARLANEMGGLKLKVCVSVGAARRAGLAASVKDALVRMIGANRDAVSQAVVSTRRFEDSETEVIDLIEHKLTYQDEIEPGQDRRLAFDSRVLVLRRAHQQWRELLEA